MPYDLNSHLWAPTGEVFFRGVKLTPLAQAGPHCVSTCLAMLTGERPETLQGIVNTQDPRTWSDALKRWGMQLAYCPTDARRVVHYLDELLAINDLFTLSYYTAKDPNGILREPDESGWVCGSHIVLLHGDQILDPQHGEATPARDHHCIKHHTKRIFRVVPAGHPRCL